MQWKKTHSEAKNLFRATAKIFYPLVLQVEINETLVFSPLFSLYFLLISFLGVSPTLFQQTNERIELIAKPLCSLSDVKHQNQIFFLPFLSPCSAFFPLLS